MPRPERAPLPRGFWVVWSAVALDLVGFGIVLPILPVYAERFGAGAFTAALLVSVFSAAQFVFAPLWGRLSDRVGRRPVLALALLGTAIGSLITGLAGGLALLFIGRIIDGASGTSYAVGQAAISDLTEPGERPRALGLLASAFGLGFVLGPLIGSLAALGSDRLPFFVAAAVAALNAALAWGRVPETRHEASVDDVIAGAGDRAGRLAVIRREGVGSFLLVALVVSLGFSGFEATLGLLLERRFDLLDSSIYGVFAAIGIGLVVVQAGLVGRVSSRLSGPRGLIGPLSLTSIGLAMLAIDGGWPTAALALVLLVLGQGLLGPLLSAATVDQASVSARGEVLGCSRAPGRSAASSDPVSPAPCSRSAYRCRICWVRRWSRSQALCCCADRGCSGLALEVTLE